MVHQTPMPKAVDSYLEVSESSGVKEQEIDLSKKGDVFTKMPAKM